MSAGLTDEPDRLEGFPHPREARRLVGHREAQAAIRDGLAAGRLHHAWLIGGPEGIGKATFAYHVAKHLLGGAAAAPQSGPLSRDPRHDDPLPVDPEARASRLVAGLAHPDLVVLRRQPSTDKKQASTQIPVDTVRRALDMFGSTAGSGGWRVCILDSAEDLNASGANALLKLVEEPPPRAIFLIVAQQPGRVLPTIRSRCRKLLLAPLSDQDMFTVLDGLNLGLPEAELRQAIGLAGGSVRRALTRLDPETMALIRATLDLLERLPDLDLRKVMALADKLAGRAGEADFAVFLETVEDWASEALRKRAAAGARHLAPLAEVWDKTGRAVRETDALNLDRKPLVLSIFQDLAGAVMRMRMA